MESNENARKEKRSVLRESLGGGPHGLGHPDDTTLRKVETEIKIPQKMREKAKTEKCVLEVKDFETCCKASGFLMVIKCREENTKLKNCMKKWYENEAFRKSCTEEYLKERSEYRRTGIKKAPKRKDAVI